MSMYGHVLGGTPGLFRLSSSRVCSFTRLLDLLVVLNRRFVAIIMLLVDVVYGLI